MIQDNTAKVNGASFRDPSGVVFNVDGSFYRQINTVYKDQYDQLVQSGLYQRLVDSTLLIPHKEIDIKAIEYTPEPQKAYKIIKPEKINFISYPYEWSFSQIKEAALTTLEIQKLSLEAGMTLKDSSAYNIQFFKGHPVLMDTLSFETYQEGEPWVAYRQFCQHFLAPLSLMAYKDIRLSQLLKIYIDGIPLDLTSRLLPIKSYLRFPILLHIHLHSASQKRYAEKSVRSSRRMTKTALQGLVDNLTSCVNKMGWKPEGTPWSDYASIHNYSSEALDHKSQLINEYVSYIKPSNVWDIGANTGFFSRFASRLGIPTISFDIDPAAVEVNYLNCVNENEENLLPLLLDLTNPSPSIGWSNQERMSLIERGPADTVMALALIHHLAISNNVPLGHIADFFQRICNWLIIEFIPKSDSQVQRLLTVRKDIFKDYNIESFESEFSKKFTIHKTHQIKESERQLYLMESV